MQTPDTAQPQAGMTLVELIISMFVLVLVVVGATGSALLYARIARDHENFADFNNALRSGLETLTHDARNAAAFSTENPDSFVVATADGAVTYAFDNDNERVTRTDSGGTDTLFANVTAMNFNTATTGELDLGLTFFVENVGTVDSTRTVSTTFKSRN